MNEPCEEVKRVEQRYEKALDDMEKHYKDVLDKIRAEIKQSLDDPYNYIVKQDAYREVMDIIDKYTKGENE